jgi:hypothetical protein
VSDDASQKGLGDVILMLFANGFFLKKIVPLRVENVSNLEDLKYLFGPLATLPNMSWLWGQSSKPPESSRETKSSSDPLRKLDPELREFLKNEAPEKYDSSNPPASSSPPPISTPKDPISYREKLLGTDSAQTEVKRSQTDTDPSKPPPQSLYQDGRYAHIWKNYRPLQDVENAGKSDQERLLDVLEGFKSRKAEIGRAALENCTMEQIAVSDCFSSGSWKSRMTMCRTENKKLERCYLMQAVSNRVTRPLLVTDLWIEILESIGISQHQ